ncbi:hypothetical protein HYPSUDRAFT_203035 [Hypholoma sublateritium FD-334 SS-4]|uniref:Uncharacterized protein n=1 Tax=Hypholoma sublateritium (strain FD-334 SS-4) TaxID=945553 RepID=A0A0D2PN21_HYPSF|nr:hypothetical protein HYPSUDRAFT_203035 [Hypholoma sublateritium FD-334 SS-4]
MASQASTPPVFLPTHRTSLPRKRKRMVRPLKDPDKVATLHGGITVVGGLQLLDEIALTEEALMDAISNSSARWEDRALIDRIAEVSCLVLALQ